MSLATYHCRLDFDGRRLQGVRPVALLESRHGCLLWETLSRRVLPFPFHNKREVSGTAILQEIRRALEWSRDNVSTRGAAIGFFSYDFARLLESCAFGGSDPPDDLQLPDLRLVFYEKLECTPLPPLPPSAAPLTAATANAAPLPSTEYSAAIARLKNYIAAGDIYQANYAQRFQESLRCPPVALFSYLQRHYPARFAAFLEWDDFAIVSHSPERFLKLENGLLTAQPIKGTAPRGSTPQDDQAARHTLAHSPKNRAENVMIVDLLRNDLGRVCQYGSVRVPALFEVATLPALHHLVSTVTGTLRPECDGVDAFAAAFPCGSITGAPKIRAQQIINEVESTRRGASFGAIGYFGFNGDMEWNVAIRTLTCQAHRAFYHVGGGIVEGSTAGEEYSEMLLKATALRHALRNAAP